jgi:glycerophosphoryl diester phosphodiesterase
MSPGCLVGWYRTADGAAGADGAVRTRRRRVIVRSLAEGDCVTQGIRNGLVVLALACVAALQGMLVAESSRKINVAHRGASAYAPEHTREAYELAIEMGADFVEQDLGVTKDGVLVCLHDPTLERTTNVRDVFPDRATRSRLIRRWHLADFTLDEIKQLDAGSWFDPKFAGTRILTWQEAIDLVRGRAGLYPELKLPSLYRERGIDVERLFVESLRRNGLAEQGADPRTPLVVQSFDAETLKTLAADVPTLPRVFLIESRDARRWMTREGLLAIRGFATGIGPAKAILDGRPELVRLAQEVGLTVIPYTFRSRATGRFPDVREEMRYFLFDLGADGVFTDNPDQFPR